MKTIITFTFLLFSYLGFSQTTREEVVKRGEDGQKLIVNTYSGTGNSEKLVKRTYYTGFSSSISLKPIRIEYYGGYKDDIQSRWGIVKIEYYNFSGVLESTWKTSNELIP